MTLLRDLAPCTHLPFKCEALTAIGWLDTEAEYTRGSVSPEFFLKLKELCRSPWQPAVAVGSHECNLCQFDGPRFSANVYVPYQEKIYVAPVAIVHYIAAHFYLPPAIFASAVSVCPTMQSAEYKQAILANGGRSLVRGGPNTSLERTREK